MKRMVALAALASLVGCTSSLPPAPDAQTLPKDARPQGKASIRLSGKGLVIPDEQTARLSKRDLLKRLSSLLKQEKRASARALVKRYPDVSLYALRTMTSKTLSRSESLWLAHYYDETTGGSRPGAWSTAVEKQRAEPTLFQSFLERRQELWRDLESGRFQEAASTQLVARLPAQHRGGAFAREGYRLMGLAHLAAAQPKQALSKLAEARRRSDGQPHEAFELELLMTMAASRLGRREDAQKHWERSLEKGVCLGEDSALNDPKLWQQAVALWPEGATFASSVIEFFKDRAPGLGTAPASQDSQKALVYRLIADEALGRREYQSALLAAKRMETSAPEQSQEARLLQARSLVGLGQIGSATSIFVDLCKTGSGSIKDQSMALLGSLKVQQSELRVGLTLLHKSLLGDRFEGRGRARADLGLAYLLCGEEERGLQALREAQRFFRSRGQTTKLLRCLGNEVKYYKHSGREDQAAALRLKMQLIERG